jgi:hypothetical protein
VIGMARARGVEPAKLIDEEFPLSLAFIPARVARRFREIEIAAGLPPGDVLASLLDRADSWWEGPDKQAVVGWVFDGWRGIKGAREVRRELARMARRWRMEDLNEILARCERVCG